MEEKLTHESFDSEFTHQPVPLEHRKSFATVAGTWFGYPMSLSNAVFGGMIVGFLGLKDGLLAVLIGAVLLFGYVGALSYRAGSTGKNFPLMAKTSFGTKGYVIVTAFLATTGIGWFAFQTGLTGNMIHSTFGLNEYLMTTLGGIFYIWLVFMGIRALSVIGWFAAPMFVVLSIIAIIVAMQEFSFAQLLNYQPKVKPSLEVFSIGAAISIVFGGFSDAGTMTADYTRWAKNGRQSVWASFTAFPVADFIAYGVGGLIVATGIIANPTKDGGNFMLFLTGHNSLLSILLFLFVFINLGSSCSHCLYNGAITWANITGKNLKIMIAIIGVLGTVLALAGVWGLFSYWLNLLGIFIPPVGGIMILDQLLFRKNYLPEDAPAWRKMPFISWALASLIAAIVYLKAPFLSYAIIGVVSAMIIYSISEFVINSKNKDKTMKHQESVL